MVSLFRSSSRDLDTLRSTVCTLHETTVPGLAAALSWRSRKVERLLIEELTRPGTSLAYDSSRRVVRWVPVTSTVWHVPPPAASSPPPAAAPPPRPKVDLGAPLEAPPPVLKGNGLRSQCPSCHVGLAASTSPSLSVCPRCGRLFTSRNATSTRDAPTAAPAAPPNPTPTAPDRRSQELLAAYMTAQPIPCPHCRTELRHRGLSEYACPSCGEVVRFQAGTAVRASHTPATAPKVPAH
jgi:predicted RNA-binding Zn-ribbon protein involved in translation (DUF1610 family)